MRRLHTAEMILNIDLSAIGICYPTHTPTDFGINVWYCRSCSSSSVYVFWYLEGDILLSSCIHSLHQEHLGRYVTMNSQTCPRDGARTRYRPTPKLSLYALCSDLMYCSHFCLSQNPLYDEIRELLKGKHDDGFLELGRDPVKYSGKGH